MPAFREMLKDAPREGPLLPSLEELVLINVHMDTQKVYYLCDLLIELAELEVPLSRLDLRTCVVADRAVQFLSEVVVDVRGPEDREEYGFDDGPPFLGSSSWDTDDEYDGDYDDGDDSDDGDDEEAW
jgi:hypothetical protein